MPYIDKKEREKYDNFIDQIASELIELSDEKALSGHLNYVISRLCWQLCGHKAYNSPENIKGTRRYFRMNEVVGAIECAKLEMYRMIIAQYENEAQKRPGNGLI